MSYSQDNNDLALISEENLIVLALLEGNPHNVNLLLINNFI